MEISERKNILEFLQIVGRLKHTKRTGWVIRDIEEPECVAGHMYRMAMMTFLLSDASELDRSKCLQLALVHDLAEAIVGDITPFCGIDPDEKHHREDEAMKDISALAGNRGKYIYQLYKEYEHQTTAEAKYVKDLDRFDMILQAFEYEKRDGKPNSLEEFFDSTKDKFLHPSIKDLCIELNEQRSTFANPSNNN